MCPISPRQLDSYTRGPEQNPLDSITRRPPHRLRLTNHTGRLEQTGDTAIAAHCIRKYLRAHEHIVDTRGVYNVHTILNGSVYNCVEKDVVRRGRSRVTPLLSQEDSMLLPAVANLKCSKGVGRGLAHEYAYRGCILDNDTFNLVVIEIIVERQTCGPIAV